MNYKNFLLGMKNNINSNKNIVCIIVGLDKFINDCQEGEYTEPVFAFEKRPFYKPKID